MSRPDVRRRARPGAHPARRTLDIMQKEKQLDAGWNQRPILATGSILGKYGRLPTQMTGVVEASHR